jgi:ubiquinone biosynthesis monooxygenase Coq7
MSVRTLSLMDRLIIDFDRGFRTIFGGAATTGRRNPAAAAGETPLTAFERRHSAGLMRVNHAGEVAAQALYYGQALTARREDVREALDKAAREENDHLAWCEQRLCELDSRNSYLDPLWYLGSLAIGAVTGLIGDKWNLGFLAETERQVVVHLDSHLVRLTARDHRSRAIIEQMREDEGRHATAAVRAGGASLPVPIRKLMHGTSKVMTTTAYWI